MSKRYRHPEQLRQSDIIKAVAELLKGHFGCKVYADEVLEGFEKPCFFIKFITTTRRQTKYVVRRTVSAILTYFPKDNQRNEIHYLDVFEQVHGLFTEGFRVGSRYLQVSRISDTRMGDEADILQITLSISYLDYIQRQYSADYIEDVQMNFKNVHGPRDEEVISESVDMDEE